MKGILIPDVKLLTEHYTRNQRGGSLPGFRGGRMQRGYGIGGIFRSLARFAIPLFKQGARTVGKRALQAATEVGQDVLEGRNVSESMKARGNQSFTDVSNKAVKTLTGRGRKRPIKRSAPAKPTISSQAKKRKTSHKIEKYNPKWNGSSR